MPRAGLFRADRQPKSRPLRRGTSGANQYAGSVVALRAATGEVVLHFQVVHHDLWDYDVPAQPVLVNDTREESVPAVVVATKMGHLFLLHRETGAPLFPIEGRRVPQSTIPGEEARPPSRFRSASTPRSLDPHGRRGVGKQRRRAQSCPARLAALRSEGSSRRRASRAAWLPRFRRRRELGGVSHDPARGLVIAPTNRLAFVVALVPRDRFEREKAALSRPGREIAMQRGTPYVMYREAVLSPLGLPCNPPPWGALTAVDLATGDVRWEVPLGSSPELSSVPQAPEWGSVNFGGALVTAGGLVFIGAARDTMLRAFDIDTGKVIWSAELPAARRQRR